MQKRKKREKFPRYLEKWTRLRERRMDPKAPRKRMERRSRRRTPRRKGRTKAKRKTEKKGKKGKKEEKRKKEGKEKRGKRKRGKRERTQVTRNKEVGKKGKKKKLENPEAPKPMEKLAGIPKPQQRRSDLPEGLEVLGFFGKTPGKSLWEEHWEQDVLSQIFLGMPLDAWIDSHLEIEPLELGSPKANWEFGWIIKRNISSGNGNGDFG